jgi:hypothetical protein
VLLALALIALQDDPNARAKEVLAVECGLDFSGKKVADVLIQLSDTQGVAFVPDLKSAPNVRALDVKSKKTGTIGEVLKDILAAHRLAYTVWEGAVIVGTAEALKEFDGGKVPVVTAKERAATDAPEWKKEIHAALETGIAFDLLAGFRKNEKAEKSLAMGFQWLGESTGLKFAIDPSAAKACSAVCTLQVSNAPASVVLAMLARQAGCAFSLEKGKTIRVRK